MSGLRNHISASDDQAKLTKAIVTLLLTLIDQILRHLASLAARPTSPASQPEPAGLASNGPMNTPAPTPRNRPNQPNAPHPIPRPDTSATRPVGVAHPSPNPAITARPPQRALAQTPSPPAAAQQSHPTTTNPPPNHPRSRISRPSNGTFSRRNHYDIETKTSPEGAPSRFPLKTAPAEAEGLAAATDSDEHYIFTIAL